MEGQRAGTSGPKLVYQTQARIAKLTKDVVLEGGKSLTTLAHHLTLEWLLEAYRRVRKTGAAGVDGQTAAEFEADLEGNLLALLEEAKSGRYRALPARRVYIPKDGGKRRPLGIPSLRDKVLQKAMVMLLEPVFELLFADFSYGFRPKRSAHDASEALQQTLYEFRGGWVLDADVSSFFDTLRHSTLREILRQWVADGVVLRLIGKWLHAGVMEGGVVTRSPQGTPQGGVISPLLANAFLHHVLDGWWMAEVLPRMRGRARLIRYADDFVMVFSHRQDAERVRAVLPKRFAAHGLTLHPEKTRLVRFRKPRNDDDPKPGTFDFLGFTHYWGKSRRGKWIPKRKTARKRFNRGLRAISDWCRRNRHLPIPVQARILAAKLRGHRNYYGVTCNSFAIGRFFQEVRRVWHKWLARRSQRGMTWDRFHAMLRRHPLPAAIAVRSALRRQPANL